MVIYQAVKEALRDETLGHHAECASNAIQAAAIEYERPSVMFRPRIFMDGDMWCALYGQNLQDGVCGFGKSPDAAMREFDKEWCRNRKEPPHD